MDFQKEADDLLAKMEGWYLDHGDLIDFFQEGSILGEDEDGGWIVGFGTFGSANLVVGRRRVSFGGYESRPYSPGLSKALSDFRHILENC